METKNNVLVVLKSKLDYKENKSNTREFTKEEITLLREYCISLDYHFSINKQNKIVKIFNPITFKYGYLKVLNNEICYGYFVKENDNSKFIVKYNVLLELNNFKKIKGYNIRVNRMIQSVMFGIYDLEILK
jgi:hypothetical protein